MNAQPHDEQPAGADPGPGSTPEPELHEATVRRAPKWSVFIIVGMLLGLLVTIAVTSAFPADPNVGLTMTMLVVGLFLVPIGAALGAIAALIADRRSYRRLRPVTVERGEVVAEPESAPDADAQPDPQPASDADAQPDPQPASDAVEGTDPDLTVVDPADPAAAPDAPRD